MGRNRRGRLPKSYLVDEGMCGGPKAAVSGEGDGAKLDVEPLVIDDLVGGLVLGLGVDVGGGTTRIFNEHGIQVSHSTVYQIQVQR
eukprot:COSAG02_NODE_25315_length_662_cov_0.973357_1_plen_85_part_01